MRLKIRAKPGSGESRFDEKTLTAFLKSRPENSKANIELIKLLAKHYKVSSSQVKIVKGFTSKEKIVEIL